MALYDLQIDGRVGWKVGGVQVSKEVAVGGEGR